MELLSEKIYQIHDHSFLVMEEGTHPTRQECPFARLNQLGRICPGRYIADSLIWMTVVTILSTIQLSKTVDASTGMEVDVDVEFIGSMSVR